MKILGISGKAHHGKDFVGGIAQEMFQERGEQWATWALAHPLKSGVYADNFGNITLEEISDTKPPHVRKLLQVEGTENGRNVRGTDVWLLEAKYFIDIAISRGIPPVEGVIVPDLRFVNEVEWARLAGTPHNLLDSEIRKDLADDLGYSDEWEFEMLENDPEGLLEADLDFEHEVQERIASAYDNRLGVALRIKADRDTLKGETATHDSETALDGRDDLFDGIIVNNEGTSEKEIRDQLDPWISMLSG